VAVTVFDTDVLIGFLTRGDAHHAEARELVRAAFAPGRRRLLCSVNYAELAVGPHGTPDSRVELAALDEALAALEIQVVPVDADLARRAAEVRARTGLGLPDAFAVATGLAALLDDPDVELSTFDERVRSVAATLLPAGRETTPPHGRAGRSSR